MVHIFAAATHNPPKLAFLEPQPHLCPGGQACPALPWPAPLMSCRNCPLMQKIQAWWPPGYGQVTEAKPTSNCGHLLRPPPAPGQPRLRTLSAQRASWFSGQVSFSHRSCFPSFLPFSYVIIFNSFLSLSPSFFPFPLLLLLFLHLLLLFCIAGMELYP